MRILSKSFDDLSKKELYEILALRQEVFVVEQDCPYLDADGKDYSCAHVIGLSEDEAVIAYTRIVPPGVSYETYASIGRVVVKSTARGNSWGQELMRESIKLTFQMHPSYNIKISAQVYLKKFYEDLGFVATGETYLEDNIPHMAMVMAKE